jgi:hypothetical protein
MRKSVARLKQTIQAGQPDITRIFFGAESIIEDSREANINELRNTPLQDDLRGNPSIFSVALTSMSLPGQKKTVRSETRAACCMLKYSPTWKVFKRRNASDG